MRDPLDHDEQRFQRMAADTEIVAAARRMQWLKLATGLIALGIIGAILLTWRGGMTAGVRLNCGPLRAPATHS